MVLSPVVALSPEPDALALFSDSFGYEDDSAAIVESVSDTPVLLLETKGQELSSAQDEPLIDQKAVTLEQIETVQNNALQTSVLLDQLNALIHQLSLRDSVVMTVTLTNSTTSCTRFFIKTDDAVAS